MARQKFEDRRLLALVLCAALSGCIASPPTSVKLPDLGATDTIIVGPASGSAHSWHLFGWKRFGDDTTEAAIRDAKKGAEDLELINPLVERRVHCFPACELAIVAWGETKVTGTLARYKRMPEWEKPKREKPAVLAIGQAPPLDTLTERLINLHAGDPKAAAELYTSLDSKTKGEVLDRVVNGMGVVSEGMRFKIPHDAPEERRKFLIWFIETYTTYQPIGE